MRAVIFAMHKETAPPFQGGAWKMGASRGRAVRSDTVFRFQVASGSGDLIVCVCGVGKVNAALAAQHLIDRFAPEEIWNAGVSGCFRDLPAGAVVAVTHCVRRWAPAGDGQ